MALVGVMEGEWRMQHSQVLSKHLIYNRHDDACQMILFMLVGCALWASTFPSLLACDPGVKGVKGLSS